MKHTAIKFTALAMTAVLMCGMLSGCGTHGKTLTDMSRDEETGRHSLSAPIPLSGFEDVSDGSGRCAYQMVAELTDTYTFSGEALKSITVTTPRGEVSGEQSVQADIKAGDTVTVEVVTIEKNAKFLVNAQADNHLQRLPYTPHFTVDINSLDLTGETSSPKATEINYQKRKGGTYVYLNNPEKLQPDDVGQAILRDEGLSGDVQVTWEHSNFTGQPINLGYQLKNEGKEDVYVTVTNIGLQVSGEWLGQQSWSDYYNYKFELPADYFDERGVTTERYQGQDFLDYTPRIFQPTTYRIPAGEYIYVLGGTSIDAYNKTNVADTANKYILPGKCSNAVAKFFVTGGEVTGTFYCYTKPEQVAAEPEEQGLINMRDGTQFGWQYKGVDHYTALIESNPVFVVDDTVEGRLPVTYEREHDKAARHRNLKPYDKMNMVKETYEGHSWTTNINPNGSKSAVGTDMSAFDCVDTDGNPITVDIAHADGTGELANVGNWMIDYHDNMTFVNQGDKARTFTINKSASGALMALVMDPEGNVLATKCTIVPLEDSPTEHQWKIYEVTVPAHSAVQLCISFLLMGNSYGNVSHWVTVE